jgi:hypothetical protein
MVTDLAAYPWSIEAAHGLGRPGALLTPLPGREGLGPDAARPVR